MPEVISYESPEGAQMMEPQNVSVSASTSQESIESDAAEEETEITPETELFPGGPTKAVIDQWKTQFGDVYVTEVADEKYVIWRTLKRAEYRKLVNDMELQIANGASNAEATMNNEEAMTKMCTLWPATGAMSIAADLAGMPSIISQQIMEASGFLSLQVRAL
jgi:hypothetical protein